MNEGALPELPGDWVWTRLEIGKIQIEALGIDITSYEKSNFFIQYL